MTGRIKYSTEKTSYVVFKFDFCKSRNLSSIEGTLPLEFPEMPSPEKYQECQTGFEKVMDSLLKSKKMTLVESRKYRKTLFTTTEYWDFAKVWLCWMYAQTRKNFIGVILRRMKFTTSLSAR